MLPPQLPSPNQTLPITPCDQEFVDQVTALTANHGCQVILSPASWCHKPLKGPGGAGTKRLSKLFGTYTNSYIGKYKKK